MDTVTGMWDSIHVWASGEFAGEFTSVQKGMSTAELGRWRKTLPLLAVKVDGVEDDLLGLGQDGMRRLTVDVTWDVIDTAEYECVRLCDLVRAGLRADPSWGTSVDTAGVRLAEFWLEPFDFSNADEPLPFLVRRISVPGLKFGV